MPLRKRRKVCARPLKRRTLDSVLATIIPLIVARIVVAKTKDSFYIIQYRNSPLCVFSEPLYSVFNLFFPAIVSAKRAFVLILRRTFTYPEHRVATFAYTTPCTSFPFYFSNSSWFFKYNECYREALFIKIILAITVVKDP